MIEKALDDSNVKVAVCSWKHTLRILEILENSKHSYDLTTIIQIQEQAGTTTLAYSIVEKSERIKIQVIPFPYLENRGLGQKLPKHPAQPSDVVSYIYSHRSSGQIKCIPITHINLVNMCKNLFKSHLLSDERRLTQNDVHLSSFPLARYTCFFFCPFFFYFIFSFYLLLKNVRESSSYVVSSYWCFYSLSAP